MSYMEGFQLTGTSRWLFASLFHGCSDHCSQAPLVHCSSASSLSSLGRFSIVRSFPHLLPQCCNLLLQLFLAAQTQTYLESTSRSSSPFLSLMSNSFDRGGFSCVSSLEAHQSCSFKRTRYQGSATMCHDYAFLSTFDCSHRVWYVTR